MNRKLAVTLICLVSFFSNAQYDSKGANESSRFRPGALWLFTGFRPAKPEKPSKYDRLIFDVTYSDWIGDRDLFTNHWASIGLNTNLLFDIPLSAGNKVSLGIGVSHQFFNVRHDNKLVINDLENTTVFAVKDSSDLFDKSVLAGNSFSIPIEIRFRNESWRHFKFHVGGKIGYQVRLLSKTVSNINGHKVLNKRFGFPDENKLIYSAHIRLGFRNWALFGSYNFNTLFSNSSSSQLNLVQMGLSISLF